MKHKNIGPDWGGQNWRPGREPGTWFRHSNQYGPMVHHGTYIVLLREKRRFSREEWGAFLRQEKAREDKLRQEENEAKAEIEIPVERAKKQAILERLREETEKIAFSKDWEIRYKAAEALCTGVQTDLYPNNGRWYSSHFLPIEWSIYFKGQSGDLIRLWECKDGQWETPRTVLSEQNLTDIGVPVSAIVKACLDCHAASTHAEDPVSPVVRPVIINSPKDWTEGGSLWSYPIKVDLIGRRYDYHYTVGTDGNPVFEDYTGAYVNPEWD